MASKSKKKTTRQTKKKKNTEQSFLKDEIIIWSALAVSILLMISNFGLGGRAGDTVSGFMIDVFGWVAYIFPFILFGITAFLISNRGNASAYIKTAAGIFLILLTCTLLHLINEWGGLLG